MTFSCTSAGGNVIKVAMKNVEKLSYIESRIMQFFWEDAEIKRHIAQVLTDWTNSEARLSDQLGSLKESWLAAKARVGDVPPA